MRAKNIIKRVTVCMLAVVLGTSVVWADDNPGLIQRAKDACKNATYDIPTVTNDIEGWPQGPAIMCDSAVVMEEESGEVLYNKAMDERRYPASTTKIMTALVALEKSNLTDTVTFTAEGLREAVPGNSYVTPVLQEGETLTMEQCLYAIMLVSGNEVSTQVAMQVGGSVEGFVEMMNQKAQEIGCKDTHFVNANGLHDENHYTTAHDLALIAQEAYKNEEFRKIVGSRYYTIPATNKTAQERVLANHHALLGDGDWHYDGCLGGKTGYTDTALNTLVTYFEKDGTVYICVVLHYKGTEIFTDTVMLAEYTKEFEKLQVSPEKYTLSGGTAIVPKGTTTDALEIQSVQTEEGKEQETFLFNGYEVGQAVVDTKAEETDKKAKKEKEASKEEKTKENKILNDSSKTFETAVVILAVGIAVGLILIVISVIKKKKKK